MLPGAGALRWAAHEHIGRSVAQGDPARTRLIQFALAVSPLPDLLNAAMAWASFATRRMTWRHVTYEIAEPHRVRVLHRAQPG